MSIIFTGDENYGIDLIVRLSTETYELSLFVTFTPVEVYSLDLIIKMITNKEQNMYIFDLAARLDLFTNIVKPTSLTPTNTIGGGDVIISPAQIWINTNQVGGLSSYPVKSFSYTHDSEKGRKPRIDCTVIGEVPLQTIFKASLAVLSQSITGGSSYAYLSPEIEAASGTSITYTSTGIVSDITAIDNTEDSIKKNKEKEPATETELEQQFKKRMPILPELIPWILDDLTPYEQALQEQNKQAKDYWLSLIKLDCPIEKEVLYDARSIGVDYLVQKCLKYSPIPVIMCSLPPFPGDFIYAEDYIKPFTYATAIAGKPFSKPTGVLKGYHYSTKNKTPIQVHDDHWGKLPGWTLKYDEGKVYVGWVKDIQKAINATVPLADIIRDSITAVDTSSSFYYPIKVARVSYINAKGKEDIEADATVTEAEKNRSDYSLPSSLIIKGAIYRYKIAGYFLPAKPIEMETTEEAAKDKELKDFEISDDGTLVTKDEIYGTITTPSGSKISGVIATIVTTKTKAKGKLTKETNLKSGLKIRYPSDFGAGGIFTGTMSYNEVIHIYNNKNFPDTESKQTSSTIRDDDEGLKMFAGTGFRLQKIRESSEQMFYYESSGNLLRRTKTDTTLSHFDSSDTEQIKSALASQDFSTLYRTPIYVTETENETYLAIGGGNFHHVLNVTKRKPVLNRKSPTDTEVDAIAEPWGISNDSLEGHLLNEITDSCPTAQQKATTSGDVTANGTKDKDPAKCPVNLYEQPNYIKPVFYDEAPQYEISLGGKGTPIVLDLPWVTDITKIGSLAISTDESVNDVTKLKKVAEKMFDDKLAKIREEITCPVPLPLKAGGAIKSIQLTNKGGNVEFKAIWERDIPNV